MSHSALIHVISKAIDKATRPLLRDFGELERLQVSKKGVANFVTNADIRTEQILVEELSYARKGWGFLTEEKSTEEVKGCEFRFVIDPIDGTTNFIHAIPYFCISVAVQKRVSDTEYETIAGVVYDPIHDETFSAEKGEGATVNRKKLQVSRREDNWLVSTTTPRQNRYDLAAANAAIEAVTKTGATIRCSGAAALDLAYVAAGRYDGTWYHSLKLWDVAAGALLVKEAGGAVSTIVGADGAPISGSLLASSAASHDMLCGLIQQKKNVA